MGDMQGMQGVQDAQDAQGMQDAQGAPAAQDSAIFRRASVRRYTDEPVTDDQVRELLRAAMAAPSACNQQPWAFAVVRDQALKQALSQASPYAKMIPGAAVALVAYVAREDSCICPDYRHQDMGAAVENLLLRATELGLGAVWIGIAPQSERMRQVQEIVPSPEGCEPFCLIAVGHPGGRVVPTGAGRYDESRVSWL